MAKSTESTIDKSTNGYNNDKTKGDARPITGVPTVLAAIALIVISVVTLPVPFQPVGKPTLMHVWYYGWITAISTGLGVLPLVLAPELDSFWIGVSNGEFVPSIVLVGGESSPKPFSLPFLCVMRQPLHPV